MENRKSIKPIFEAIVVCGKHDLAFSAHRDSGHLVVENSRNNNERYVRELLRYRALVDVRLRYILEGLHNIYLSSTSQNAIDDSFNNVLLRKIVSSVNKAKCFTVLADKLQVFRVSNMFYHVLSMLI